MLPDLLTPGLKLVICGSAAGQKSAEVGQYYAGPGNQLWPTLFEVGLTPRQLKPEEWQTLLEFGIGLTDLVKGQSGPDSAISFKDGANDLRRKIRKFEPKVMAFNGKRAAQEFFGLPTANYGLLKSTIGTTTLFVAPSTSAAAKSSWDPRWWQALAKLV